MQKSGKYKKDRENRTKMQGRELRLKESKQQRKHIKVSAFPSRVAIFTTHIDGIKQKHLSRGSRLNRNGRLPVAL